MQIDTFYGLLTDLEPEDDSKAVVAVNQRTLRSLLVMFAVHSETRCQFRCTAAEEGWQSDWTSNWGKEKYKTTTLIVDSSLADGAYELYTLKTKKS